MKQKGSIPLLIAIIISVVAVTTVTTGVVLHKQGKLSPLVASITQVFKETENTKPEVKSEEPQLEQKQDVINEEGRELEEAAESESNIELKPELKLEPEPIVGIEIEEEISQTEQELQLETQPEQGETENEAIEKAIGTEVGGIISENTIWTLENNPYIVTDDVLIEKEVTLKIEQGVIIKFQRGEGKGNKGGFEIINKGNIIARGTPSNKIIFTSFEPDPQLGDWGTIEIISGGSIDFDHIEIEYASSGIDLENTSSAIITNNYIHNCGTGIFVNKGPAIISNNLIEENYAGISFMHIPYSGSFDDGTFHYQGLRETKITYNTIRNNIGQSSNEYHTAIRIELNAFLYSLIISHNDIYNNSGGIIIRETGGFNTSIYKLPTIEQNNIYNNKFHYNNKDYAVFLNGESEIEIDMSNNWWGITDTEAIDSLIYDYYDSFRPGTINYQPISTSEIPDTGIE